MKNRSVVSLQTAWLILITLVLAWASGAVALAAEHKGKPNILFILTDDQRLEDIDHMPRLNKLLVAQGISFQNYFDTVSLCCPSRTSILRGQYAHNTGVMTNGGDNGGFVTAHKLGVENSTIATWMHDRGYTTALIGKYLNHYPGALGQAYVPPGWDYWASPSAGNPYSEYNYTLNENGKSVRYGHTPQDYGTDVYLQKATDFINSRNTDGKPFFMYLAFYAPHGPATPADRHLNMFADAKIQRTKAFNESDVSNKPDYIKRLNQLTDAEIAGEDAYYGKRLRSLQAVDEAIEKLYNTLAENKQLDNTYIFFVSDNGFHLGEHRMRRGKQTAYETDIHLPMIVRGPGIAHGASASALVGNIDLAPTWADLAGATTPQFVDGRSLQTILHGKEVKPSKWRQAYVVEHWNQDKPNAGKKQASELGENQPIATTTSIEPPAGAESSTSASVPLKEEADVDQPMDNASNPASAAPTPEQPARPKRKRAGRKRRQRAAHEMSRIPEFHALRTPDSTYVEYATGEREFYKVTDDPDEIDNLATKEQGKLKPLADELKEMLRK